MLFTLKHLSPWRRLRLLHGLVGVTKAPGPDGLTFKFIKRYWDIIRDDEMMAVQKFEDSDTLSMGCNSSSITLAPKSKDPTSLADYRP